MAGLSMASPSNSPNNSTYNMNIPPSQFTPAPPSTLGQANPAPPLPVAPSSSTSNAFGCVVAGRPVRTDFVPVDPSNLKFTLNLNCPGDLQAPLASIREVVFFLLPGISLPNNHGALCYYQLTAAATAPNTTPASTGFEILGALTPDEPSAVFSTGWSEKEEIISVSQTNTPIQVTFAISIEPLDTVQNILGGKAKEPGAQSNRLYVAQQIARDLFTFMQSFDTGAGGASNMVVPQNVFDRWYRRFENRFQRDPNFFLKKKD